MKNYIHPAYDYIKNNGFDLLYANLMKEVDSGFINRKKNNNFELFDYSRNTMFENHWNEFTLMSRGLILDVNRKKIAALCMPKFFNYGEKSYDLPDETFSISEKKDGSMGIVFWDEYEKSWQVSTRGSFVSEQAMWAKSFLYNNIDVDKLIKTFIYITEIIYPENRIVVNYGNSSELALLTIYDLENGRERYREMYLLQNHAQKEKWFTYPERYDFNSIDDIIKNVKTWDSNHEGVVVRFENGYRIKIKSDEYCRVHKIISDMSPLSIWESMKSCDNLELIKKELPEEFWGEFDGYVNIFQKKFDDVYSEISCTIEMYKEFENKEIGLRMNNDNRFVLNMVFAYKKGEYNPLETGKIRDRIFDTFRPMNNIIK